MDLWLGSVFQIKEKSLSPEKKKIIKKKKNLCLTHLYIQILLNDEERVLDCWERRQKGRDFGHCGVKIPHWYVGMVTKEKDVCPKDALENGLPGDFWSTGHSPAICAYSCPSP